MKEMDSAYPCNGGYSYVGYDEWLAGTADTFAGVHLVDDMTYSLTVKAEELPYHYDITYASLRPRPLAVIAPDCDVVDTENGAQITGDFTADLLKETINNTETGYRRNPKVTCGPYLFDSFDEAGQQATLKANPEFVGDYRGVKPSIETLVIKTVSSDTMMNELEAGTVDVLYSASGGDTINAAWTWWKRALPTRLLTCVTATASCSSTAVCSPPTLRRSARPSLTAWTATSSPVSTPAVTLRGALLLRPGPVGVSGVR